jgi:hypothetical protein
MSNRLPGRLHSRLATSAGKLRAALTAAAVLACISAGLIAGTSSPASAASSVLAPGQQLTAGQELTAGPYVLIMQGDGNLVEYNGPTPLWATDTAGQPGNRATMQTDGNLIVYGSQNQVRWSSKQLAMERLQRRRHFPQLQLRQCSLRNPPGGPGIEDGRQQPGLGH